MLALKSLWTALSLFYVVESCTEFFIKTKDKNVLVGRTMEFATDLKSKVVLKAIGTQEKSSLPPSCGQASPLEWSYKYNVLCLNALKQPVCTDGVNSAGLSVGVLYLPQYTVYDNVTQHACSDILSNIQTANFILATYNSTQQLRNDINGNIFPKVFDMEFLGAYYPLHYTVTDSSGDALVLEYTKDGRKAHDNTIGVTTNSPPYDFHIMNIKNYVTLSKFSSKNLRFGDVVFTPAGIGSGLLGVPGDFTPPSRFIRMASLLHFSNQPNTTDEALKLTYHLLNTVDIPKGAAQVEVEPEEGHYDYTQWVVMKDLKNQVIYLRFYDDFTFKTFDLKTMKPLTSGVVSCFQSSLTRIFIVFFLVIALF
ncbi:penicillin acylase-like [Hydractinia symbiolongicarpus]|uniref:penicillin acylase-like n=1 Tax=Hydractinia symbiolongicarpus TaxID=13093 RepID=UPI00254DDF70|nr:penicillin acylase-like [Hydractinia symbiolongicarpus]